jgi:hypothetical protein
MTSPEEDFILAHAEDATLSDDERRSIHESREQSDRPDADDAS